MKKVLNVLFLVVLMLMLSGCVKHVEDTNGPDNYEIQTFTDEEITSKRKSYITVGSVQNVVNNKNTFKALKFTGIYELKKVDASNQSLTFFIVSECTSGNFRIVIVHDNAIIHDVKINDTESIILNNCNGKYSLVIVGESAKMNIEYSISKG